jgi:hypothetical protein
MRRRGPTLVIVIALLAAASGCDRFARRGDTVLDRRTGLEWTACDHGQALSWTDADRHCRGLARGDGPAWRLPELDEVEPLYDERFDAPCGDKRCHLDPAISLASPYVWTATSRGEGARFYFDFAYGNSFSPGIGPQLVRRVLCVRDGRRGAG